MRRSLVVAAVMIRSLHQEVIVAVAAIEIVIDGVDHRHQIRDGHAGREGRRAATQYLIAEGENLRDRLAGKRVGVGAS